MSNFARAAVNDEDDEARLKQSLEEKVSSRLLQRRNHLTTSVPAASVLNLQSEEGSDSDSDSDSSEEGPEVSQEAVASEGPGQLLQALTSKWKSHTEKMVVQIAKSGIDLNERLAEPWDPGFAKFKQSLGAEALHFAVRLGLLQACSALLQQKADVDAQTDTGVSALMVAVMFNKLDVAKLLIGAKASVLKQEANGLTVTDLAILEGNAQMVQMLLKREKQEDEELEQEVMQAALDAGADISLLPPVDEALALDEEAVLDRLKAWQG